MRRMTMAPASHGGSWLYLPASCRRGASSRAGSRGSFGFRRALLRRWRSPTSRRWLCNAHSAHLQLALHHRLARLLLSPPCVTEANVRCPLKRPLQNMRGKRGGEGRRRRRRLVMRCRDVCWGRPLGRSVLGRCRGLRRCLVRRRLCICVRVSVVRRPALLGGMLQCSESFAQGRRGMGGEGERAGRIGRGVWARSGEQRGVGGKWSEGGREGARLD